MGISHVPEGRRVFPAMTVLENLELGAYLRRDRAEINKDLKMVYDRFPILYDRKTISRNAVRGEQQMLAIGRHL